ncbi:MAG: SDR family NAD(P)-dependent oxidoreductase [Candidatus Marinimicrobia bacterium]|nr:SDR family NAD(P)-dependent oxidoreductase [Candidatus Neomarinimicrobiota bacterium]
MNENNRVALVTGSSSGIGAVLTEALLSAGWTVVGIARRTIRFDHPDYEHVMLDLSDLASLKTIGESRLAPILSNSQWTRVALINNAAVPGAYKTVAESDPQQLAQVFAVNTIAPVYLMGLALRSVAPEIWLRIVNISSGAAGMGIAGLGDYGSSKAALRVAGLSLAAELDAIKGSAGDERKTAILSYEPGVVDTPMQTAARSADPETFPSSGFFQELSKKGALQPPEAVIGDIIEFLNANSKESFVERRFGVL